ncbi:MAG: CBS domain-containing protein [Rhodospirillaceae bacterium]|jgi:CBS domain-containing protein|nr:CBS domain-containing protein [Rhodospirillaceae bacterium]MBT4427640.1 CBS domain-containing protein [Rhodospirillaceae bacterium]MBT5040598.1 CBS domain-containing protein [Rhodospirillaceae bacterium]MBT5675335.1 CBS domain-containing protein [Rhodospirillaceae bacterium]MBT5781140.1 CBS domain-containing protein [Rhodospirillaceae bacterium]
MQIAAILRAKGSAVARVGSMSNVAEALKVLQQKRIGAVVVADDDTSVDGVLSERDIVRGLVEHGAEALDFPVTTLMTSDVITCSEDRTVDELLRDMTEHRIRHLPVLRDGHLAGIVSIGDLVKYRLDELEGERDAMRDYIATG